MEEAVENQAQSPDAWCAGAPMIEVLKCVRGALGMSGSIVYARLGFDPVNCSKIVRFGIVNHVGFLRHTRLLPKVLLLPCKVSADLHWIIFSIEIHFSWAKSFATSFANLPQITPLTSNKKTFAENLACSAASSATLSLPLVNQIPTQMNSPEMAGCAGDGVPLPETLSSVLRRFTENSDGVARGHHCRFEEIRRRRLAICPTERSPTFVYATG
ncbi:hypothetical protein U1Q18_004410 [Sarracenia purpurea var. burkii]